ncbi:MAG: hypothetical protein GY820_46090 [Gammaproteobacteria bacterium]|nr:hypothetical protein [Gammaproteobacteria bacterium]
MTIVPGPNHRNHIGDQFAYLPVNLTWIRNRRDRKPQTGRFQHWHMSME